MIILGKKELAERSVTLRTLGKEDQEKINIEKLNDFFKKECMMPSH